MHEPRIKIDPYSETLVSVWNVIDIVLHVYNGGWISYYDILLRCRRGQVFRTQATFEVEISYRLGRTACTASAWRAFKWASDTSYAAWSPALRIENGWIIYSCLPRL